MKVEQKSTLTRISIKSLGRIRQLAKKEGMTVTKTLDYVITKFLKNNKFYELD